MSDPKDSATLKRFWWFLGIFVIWAVSYGIREFGLGATGAIGVAWFGIFVIYTMSKS